MQENGLDCVTGLGKYKGRLIILLDVDKVLAAREIAIGPAAVEVPTAGKRGAKRLGWKIARSQADMNTSEAPALTDAELKLLQALVYQECGMQDGCAILAFELPRLWEVAR